MTKALDITRRTLLGAGAGSWGALALGAGTALAATEPDPSDDALLGGEPSLHAQAFPEVAPPAVAGATMAVGSYADAIGYGGGGGSSTLTFVFAGGINSAFSASAVLCPLDIPTGGRLVRIDFYGYRAAAGTQTWRMLELDATTGLVAFISDTVSPNGTGLLHTELTGIDIAVQPGRQLIADLLFSSANNAYSSVVYQYMPPPPAGLLFTPLTPFRAYDSRWPGAAGPLAANTNRTVSIKDAHNTDTGAVTVADVVPAGAQAVTYNLTVTGTVDHGFLAITPAGAAGFAASAVNWSGSGQDLANGGSVPVSAGREVTVWAGFTGSTQFIVDVTGYYR
jgi:hypothetical protein